MIEKKGKRKKERKKEKRIEITTKKLIKTQFSPNFGLCACLKNQNEA